MTLPSGKDVFRTCPEVLFIWELVFGGLVWILIASSLVPLPLYQGWVMFVSVFCFISTAVLFFLYIIGAHDEEASWETLDSLYHGATAILYMSAAVLQVHATIVSETENPSNYFVNSTASFLAFITTLLYTLHAFSNYYH
ncbi:myelin and lymphocyte protein-like [Diceros bicornis minor]|uniref:myelin and lymphocyte protein-like n=1 Tax=Diceros bicornis minor TaxID=77932 RepID=UPI0026EE5E5D|nr:myelin and lymphocyte protein-like [Diceros bicornis minor]